MTEHIGLQIRPDRIDAVAVSIAGEKISVLEYFSSGYGGTEELGAALVECASRFSEIDAYWSVGLPSEDFSFRHLSFPFRNKKAIKRALAFELENLLPFNAESIEVSYQTVASGEETRLFACAVLKEKLAVYLKALKEAGISARVIVPDAAALLHFGKGILRRRETMLLAEAEENRMLLCHVGENGYMDFHVTQRDPLEVERFLASFEKEPERRYIAGDAADREFLAAVKDSGTWKVDFRMSLGSSIPPERMMVPLGLAARGVLPASDGLNFSKESGISGKFIGRFGTQGIGFALFLLLVLGHSVFDDFRKQNEIEGLKAATEEMFKKTLPGVKMVKPAFQLAEKVREIEERLKATGFAEGGRTDFLWVLLEVSRLTPASPEVQINLFSYDERGITLSGRTDGFDTVNSFRDALAKSESFQSVDVGESELSADKGSVNFKLRIKY